MIARLKKNFHLWEIPDDAVIDFEIIEQYCPLCEKIAHKLIIREWRPLTESDNYSWRWGRTQLILAYNQPSPRGRLGERRRCISYDMFTYDFRIDGQNILGLITHDGYEINFLRTRRKFNEKLWDVLNAVHIYEDGYGSEVLWAVKKDNGDIKSDFLNKIELIHKTCEKNAFTIGCRVFFESEKKLVHSFNGVYYEFAPSRYDIRYLEEIFRIISYKYIDEFNQKSLFFNAKMEGDYIVIRGKNE